MLTEKKTSQQSQRKLIDSELGPLTEKDLFMFGVGSA
jgi:hypothetical protein